MITEEMIDAVLAYREEEARKDAADPKRNACWCLGPPMLKGSTVGRCQCYRKIIRAELKAALSVDPSEHTEKLKKPQHADTSQPLRK